MLTTLHYSAERGADHHQGNAPRTGKAVAKSEEEGVVGLVILAQNSDARAEGIIKHRLGRQRQAWQLTVEENGRADGIVQLDQLLMLGVVTQQAVLWRRVGEDVGGVLRKMLAKSCGDVLACCLGPFRIRLEQPGDGNFVQRNIGWHYQNGNRLRRPCELKLW